MTDQISTTLPLTRWQGERGTYHLVTITGENAEQIAMHERLRRLEYGTRRGFGSVKVSARIGETRWKTSVFPLLSRENDHATRALRPSARSLPGDNPGGRAEGAGGPDMSSKKWILLVSKKVMKAEGLEAGDVLTLRLELL